MDSLRIRAQTVANFVERSNGISPFTACMISVFGISMAGSLLSEHRILLLSKHWEVICLRFAEPWPKSWEVKNASSTDDERKQ